MNDGKRIKIALLTAHTQQNRKRSSWGNTADYMTQALQKYCGEVYSIGPVPSKSKLVGKVMHKCSRILLKKNFAYNHSFAVAREYAKVVAPRLAGQSFDIIVAPSCGTDIAFLETPIPILLIEDATFALLQNYYPQYSNLLQRSIYETNTLEEISIKKASILLYTSAWAAQSALEDYHADKQKVYVAPFGANLDNPPSQEIVQAKKKSGRCRLLFVGVDWQRKGGEIAFETLLQLEEMGVQAELIVCGCTPPKMFVHERMTIIPFLDKHDDIQQKQLERLYETSSFLILPTRSDCLPMVLSEANAFGLPAITTNTGGIPEIIRDGENGFLLPLSAKGAEFAAVIAKIYQDDQRYAALVKSSRRAFEDKLNWDVWGAFTAKIIHEMLGRETSRRGSPI